jgi:hypothetical protein
LLLRLLTRDRVRTHLYTYHARQSPSTQSSVPFIRSIFTTETDEEPSSSIVHPSFLVGIVVIESTRTLTQALVRLRVLSQFSLHRRERFHRRRHRVASRSSLTGVSSIKEEVSQKM